MKRFILFTAFVLFGTVSFGQDIDAKNLVDSIKYLEVTAIDCKAGLFWRIVKQGDKAIPYLIDKITDTTLTNISSSHCKKKLSVGEVAYEALYQIAEMPLYVMTKIQSDDFIALDDCGNFYDYFYDNANKPEFQKILRDWFAAIANKYKRKKIRVKYRTECEIFFKIETYYKWIE